METLAALILGGAFALAIWAERQDLRRRHLGYAAAAAIMTVLTAALLIDRQYLLTSSLAVLVMLVLVPIAVLNHHRRVKRLVDTPDGRC